MVFTTLRVMAQVGLYCQYYPECALALPPAPLPEGEGGKGNARGPWWRHRAFGLCGFCFQGKRKKLPDKDSNLGLSG
jgi:hypothetical protein